MRRPWSSSSRPCGQEEKALAALTEELGPDVPVIGGTAAGPSKDIDLRRLREGLEWSAVVNDRVITGGAVIAVFYTSQPFAWAYAGGFERSGPSPASSPAVSLA